MPIDDWQFWAAGALALTALFFLLRPLFPRARRGGACPGCPGGSAKPAAKRARLTIEGEASRRR